MIHSLDKEAKLLGVPGSQLSRSGLQRDCRNHQPEIF